MSFQAYIDNIKAKTGKSPEDFKSEAEAAGIMKENMKAGELVNWLKSEYGLGHGHAMAVWNVFVTSGWVNTTHSKLKSKGG